LLHAWFVAKDASYSNGASIYVAEFFARKRLAKLGYTSSFSELDQEQVEVFLAIDSKIEELKAKELKRGAKR
jgi:hypothetical protein